MRTLFVFLLVVSLVGCNFESNSNSENTVTNPDGSVTTTKIEKKTKNGVTTGKKTELTIGPGGKRSIITYEWKNGDWVKTSP